MEHVVITIDYSRRKDVFTMFRELQHGRGTATLVAFILALYIMCSSAYAVTACYAESSEEAFGKIGIIAAMDKEIELLLESLQEPRTETAAGITYHSGVLGKHEVILAKSGVGKVNAAMGAQIMILKYQPDCIINTGCAGGLSDNIKIGDIVLSTQTVEWDMDTTVFGDPRGYISSLDTVRIEASPGLRRYIRNCIPQGIKVHEGLIASGDQFVYNEEQRSTIMYSFPDVCCVEMEGSAIGHVCAQNRIPFCIVRCISDSVGEKGTETYEEFSQRACHLAAKTVISMCNAE